jgi:hypothetical protein
VISNVWPALSLVLLWTFQIQAELNPCHFNYGMPFKSATYAYPSELDFLSIWVGDSEDFNIYWEGAMLKACLPGGKMAGRTPVYYSYIAAFTARRDQQLKDCDVGTPSLCQKGANFIRQYKPRILAQYAKYASETAKIWGTEKPIIWMMEPDFYQYASGTQQEGGPITFTEAGALMGEMVATIKKSLPNAIFSLDISPWVANPASWYAAFDMKAFTYINTSSGRTEADDVRIRKANPMTWSAVHLLTKKPILADEGYGVGGASIGHDDTWDVPANLNARIADGVISIGQANPRTDWNGIIVATRPALSIIPNCGTGVWVPIDAGIQMLRIIPANGERDLLGRIRWPYSPLPSNFLPINPN